MKLAFHGRNYNIFDRVDFETAIALRSEKLKIVTKIDIILRQITKGGKERLRQIV